MKQEHWHLICPDNKEADVLAVTVNDPNGRELVDLDLAATRPAGNERHPKTA